MNFGKLIYEQKVLLKDKNIQVEWQIYMKEYIKLLLETKVTKSLNRIQYNYNSEYIQYLYNIIKKILFVVNTEEYKKQINVIIINN